MNTFDINDNTQQYPPLALMATSKHSPPLTTMTKEPFYLTAPPVTISPPDIEFSPLSVFVKEILPSSI